MLVSKIKNKTYHSDLVFKTRIKDLTNFVFGYRSLSHSVLVTTNKTRCLTLFLTLKIETSLENRKNKTGLGNSCSEYNNTKMIKYNKPGGHVSFYNELYYTSRI